MIYANVIIMHVTQLATLITAIKLGGTNDIYLE